MTSKIKVDNIHKVSDDSLIIKKCGSTTTVGSGSGQTIVVDGATVTLGRCGGAVNLASGATQTGFGRTGTVDWQTGSIKTSTFTAVNGQGFFANTSSGAFTMNLPAGTAGNIVSVVDYTNTFQTHNLTIAANGTQKIGGVQATVALSTEGQSVTLVYVDDIEGWKNVQDSTSNVTGLIPYIVASGGTESNDGDFKVHTFTGPGTFTISCASTVAPRNGLEYLVVGGGGGGALQNTSARGGGGGGAGGYRTSAFGPSPLQAPTINAAVGPYPVTVGAGGAGGCSPGCGVQGSTSTFAGPTSIASAGGGGGRGRVETPGQPGGSGGGAGDGGGPTPFPGGTGNTPPVSPPQGNNGGTNFANPNNNGGGGAGGGGAGGAGSNESSPGGYPASGSAGGPGVPNAITGSGVTYAAGAEGGPTGSSPRASGPANSGNGGVGGGGGYPGGSPGTGGAGGSGIVVIRYRFQN
jgi:hypothetical protein